MSEKVSQSNIRDDNKCGRTQNGSSTPDITKFIDGIKLRVLVPWVVDKGERVSRLGNQPDQ
jgi:hypothetical protein